MKVRHRVIRMTIQATLCSVCVWLIVSGSSAQSQTLADLLEQADDSKPPASLDKPAGEPARSAAPLPVQGRPVADGAAKPAPHRRAPVPSESDASAALARVKVVFREQYAGSLRSADKARLAKEMLDLLESTTTKADRWALQSEAMHLASEGGQVDLAVATARKFTTEFQVDAGETIYGVLKELSMSASTDAIGRLAAECIVVARSALDEGSSAAATKAIALAKALARKAKDGDLVAQVNRLSIAAKEREKTDKRLATVMAELKETPADPELSAEAGLILCLTQNRWAVGLPMLMKGGNPALARLAQLEANGAKTVKEQVALGNAWWAWAETQKGQMQDAAQQRAITFYNEAVAGSEGLERAMLEKRIASIALGGGGTGETIALADLQESETAEVYGGVTKDGTFNGVAYTCGGVKHPKGIYTAPKSQGTAMVAFRPPPGSRRLRGTVGVFTVAGKEIEQPGSAMTMEVAVDGQVVWTSPPLTKREQVAKFDVAIDRASRVELRTRAAGNNASCWGAWLDPVFVK